MTLHIATHRSILTQILKDIYSDTTLGPILGFKGGTAAYLFYDLSRFSVDLDFDLFQLNKEDEVYQKIEKILQNYGTIRDPYKKKNTLFFRLAYEGNVHSIKVEISRRGLPARYEVKNHLGIAMLVMAKEDLFANKLIALLNRKNPAHRDIYDVWFFLKNNWPVNPTMIRERSGLDFKDYLKKCAAFLEKFSDDHILQGIGELLTEKQKVWAKANLKNDCLFLLKLKLESDLVI